MCSKEEIEKETIEKILVHLDGWSISEDEKEIVYSFENQDGEEENDELYDGVNKPLSIKEVDSIYNASLIQAQNITKRLLNSFTPENLSLFMNAVYVLTASNLFSKYNIVVDNNQEEGHTLQSRAGVLYSQAMNQLNSHKITTVKTRKSISDNKG